MPYLNLYNTAVVSCTFPLWEQYCDIGVVKSIRIGYYGETLLGPIRKECIASFVL